MTELYKQKMFSNMKIDSSGKVVEEEMDHNHVKNFEQKVTQ